MSAAPVAVLLPLFQCVSSSFFPPVSSSDPLFLAASPVHGSCFACLRSGMPSPSPPERKIPTCICRSGSFSHGRSYGGMGYLSFSGGPFFSAASRFAEPSICEYFPCYRSLSQFSFAAPHFAAPLLRPLFCGFPFVVPLLRPPFAAPLWLSPFAVPLSWPPSRPPGKGYFWNR